MAARHKCLSACNTTLERGATLIEALVAVVITALGILGIVGVQLRTLSDTQGTVRRAQAIRLIEDLGERMQANPNALVNLSAYLSGFNDTPSSSDCASSACDSAALAAHDIALWKQTVAESLPLGRANVFLAPADTDSANRRQLGVMLAWRENERDGLKSAVIDATQERQADGSFVAAAGSDSANACPAGRSCHLQYLPVLARCSPYFTPGSAAAQTFCPGS